MSKRSNALIHGVYSKDIVLPWERLEAFEALLDGIRLDFQPQGTTEDEIVFEIAVLHWRKRRIHSLLQFEFVDAQFAREGEKTGKQGGNDIFSVLREKGREKVDHTNAVVRLSDAVASLADQLNRSRSLGKLGANLRSLMSEVEELKPIIETRERSVDEAKKIDRANSLEMFRAACELEARLDTQIDKKIQRLVMIREFQRQYGQNSNLKLLPREQSTTHSTPATKEPVTRVGLEASLETNDDSNYDGENDNDNEIASAMETATRVGLEASPEKSKETSDNSNENDSEKAPGRQGNRTREQ
jgi:hypothetical protein